MENKYFCPVCGLRQNTPPWDGKFPSFDICACCGTEYGLHDAKYEITGDTLIFRDLRKKWIANGMKWWSKDTKYNPQPQNWNPAEQLKNIPEEFR